MAVQQNKKSKSRTRMGRAHHAISTPGLIDCPQCGEKKRPHRVCTSCGYYKGKEIIEPNEA